MQFVAVQVNVFGRKANRTGQTPPSSQDSNKVHELEGVVIIETEDISWSSFHQAPVVQAEVSKGKNQSLV
jgi:hypothetical protein